MHLHTREATNRKRPARGGPDTTEGQCQLSTLGIAHHRRGTHTQLAKPDPLRAARIASRDAEYRAALGVPAGEPLPPALGMTYQSGGRFVPMAAGGYRRGRAR